MAGVHPPTFLIWQVEHIKNEKEILAEINHPFIVILYGCAQDQRNLYMVSISAILSISAGRVRG